MLSDQPTAGLKVGDHVLVALSRAPASFVEIVRIMPADADGELQYRVRGADGLERAVARHQIRPAKAV